MKRFAALVTVLVMLFSFALAEETFAPHWTQLEEEMAEGRTMRLALTADLKEWSPFPQEVTDSINQLLKHFSFCVDYQKQPQESGYAMTILVDDAAVVTVAQQDTESESRWYSDLYDAVYTLERGSGAQPLALMTQPEQETMNLWEELLLGQIDLDGLAEHLTRMLMEEGIAAKSTKNLSKIGRAAKTYKITTDGEGVQAIVREAVKALGFPMAETFVENLTFSGSKNIFTLYEKKDGTILGVNFTGYAAYGDGDKRKVSLTWGYKQDGEARLDTFSLTAPSAKGSNNLTVKFNWDRGFKASANTQKLEGTVTSVLNKVKTSHSYALQLKNAKGLNGHQVTGNLEITETKGDVKNTLLIKPALQTAADESGASFRGNLEIRKLQGKKVLLDAALGISMDPKDESVFVLSEPLEVIPLEEMDPEALTETDNDLAMMLAHRLLVALMQLPADELKVLQTGISDRNWEQVLETFQQIAP